MMKKIINFTSLFVLMVLLVGCIEEKGQLSRVDVKKIDTEGKYEDVVMITDRESIELLRQAFEQIKWDDKVIKMARKPDVEATLFYTFDENKPERLYEYEIWFNESAGTATIISNNENESYGELDKDNAKALNNIFLN
jgi:PBP1b-binding outer membrane lipoprotein LpoB